MGKIIKKMPPRELRKWDIVQLKPTRERFGGFLVVVTEIKPFGCQGYLMHYDAFEAVRVLKGENKPAKAYVRVKHEDMQLVGRLFWVENDEFDKEED